MYLVVVADSISFQLTITQLPISGVGGSLLDNGNFGADFHCFRGILTALIFNGIDIAWIIAHLSWLMVVVVGVVWYIMRGCQVTVVAVVARGVIVVVVWSEVIGNWWCYPLGVVGWRAGT